MKLPVLMLLLLSPTAFSCEESLEIKTEKNVSLTLCQFKKLQVDQNCSLKRNDCPLIKELKVSVPKSLLLNAGSANPGAGICKFLGLKVHQGYLFDGSEVCTCKNQAENYVTCVSLFEHFRK